MIIKKRIEEYCGAKTDPKTSKKLLQEIDETEIQIAELDAKLTDLKTRLEHESKLFTQVTRRLSKSTYGFYLDRCVTKK